MKLPENVIDMRDVVANRLSINVTLTRAREFSFRVFVAGLLLRVGCQIVSRTLGCSGGFSVEFSGCYGGISSIDYLPIDVNPDCVCLEEFEGKDCYRHFGACDSDVDWCNSCFSYYDTEVLVTKS